MNAATHTAPDWNVIVTLPEATFREARNLLRRWGEVRRTDYFHVLTIRVDDDETFLAEIAKAIEESPGILNFVSHIIPAQRTFDFDTPEEFERKARDVAILWAPTLAGKSFHVRLHRHGFKGKLSIPKEERFLDERLMCWTPPAGLPLPIRTRSCRSRPSMVAPGCRCGAVRISGAIPFLECPEGTTRRRRSYLAGSGMRGHL
jgi:hypothetical protein